MNKVIEAFTHELKGEDYYKFEALEIVKGVQ